MRLVASQPGLSRPALEIDHAPDAVLQNACYAVAPLCVPGVPTWSTVSAASAPLEQQQAQRSKTTASASITHPWIDEGFRIVVNSDTTARGWTEHNWLIHVGPSSSFVTGLTPAYAVSGVLDRIISYLPLEDYLTFCMRM
ncbi:hypothetical protein DTO212C5_3247 [Paecilomyces variotii]|nr:hypothetical protein DTO212C5_3247 [Paecilomyces variotii]